MKANEILGYEKVNGTEEEKVNEIANSIKENGWVGAPILTYGNLLLTGSHRLAAIEILAEEDFDLNFDCAYDVQELVDEYMDENELTLQDVFNYTDGGLKNIFVGTWVEEYAEMIREW